MMATVKVLDGGKVTIPSIIREDLEIEQGDTIFIEVEVPDE